MKAFRLLTLVIVAALVLSACAPAPEPQVVEVEKVVTKEVEKIVEKIVEVPAERGVPKYGGTLTVAVPNIVHLDVVGVNQYGLNEVAQLFVETLVDRDENGEVQPLLIKSIDISEDGLTHTWALQEGVTFHADRLAVVPHHLRSVDPRTLLS